MPQRHRRPGVLPALVAALGTALGAAGQGRPTYDFEVGAQWVYDSVSQTVALDDETPQRGGRARIALWVLAEQDGQWLVLLAQQRWVEDRRVPGAAIVMHLDASGFRRVSAPVARLLPELHDALDIVPVLPRGAQHEIEWATPPDLRERYWRCYGRGLDATHDNHWRVEFAERDHRGVLDAQRREKSGVYWYDPAAGRISSWTSTLVDRARRTRTMTRGELRSAQTFAAGWCQRRVVETGLYENTLAHEQRLLKELVVAPGRVEQVVTELDQLWRAFRSDLMGREKSPYDAIARARQRHWGLERDRLVSRARLGARWYNRDAVRWTLQDPVGKTHTWEAQRERVMVECFWSVRDSASLDTLAVLRELQADLPESRIGVLCFNMDQNWPDAVAAIRHCGEGLKNLLGGPLAQIDPVPEYPVVRVVDRAGVVRGLWIGWRPEYPAARTLAYELAGLKAP